MNNTLKCLHNLNSEEGSLTWNQCNQINLELVQLRQGDIPRDQTENIINYIDSVLACGSPLPEHREKLAFLHAELSAFSA